MINNKVVLTIAIPTFNRALKLREGLYRLSKLVKNDSIEIIVSDNASTDCTEEVVSEFLKSGIVNRYYKNDTNLGFDGNFLNCFNKAEGKYVWLLSDDDYLLDGAIENIIDGLKRMPVCMHLNSSSLVDDEQKKISEPRFQDEGMAIYTNKNEFIKKIGIYCTFVSALIFNREYILSLQDKEQYYGTNILQSHVFFETMRNEGEYILITYNCLASRGNRKVSYDIYRTWIMNYGQLLMKTAIRCGFDYEIMRNVLYNDYENQIYDFVLLFRETCNNSCTWDKVGALGYIAMFPDLKKKYEIAMNCPRFFLKVLRVFRKLKIARRKE